jgi:alanine racemase
MPKTLSWCEVSFRALKNNIHEFARIVGSLERVAPVVKANAYGHGVEVCARVFEEIGIRKMCVNDLSEAMKLRFLGLESKIFVLGYIPPCDADEVIETSCIPVVYDLEVLGALDEASRKRGKTTEVIVKIETGTNRQGLSLEQAMAFVEKAKSLKNIQIVGLSTHFADIEDTTDHTFARLQLTRFEEASRFLKGLGLNLKICTVANSAATILWNETHMDLVRPGIAVYGLWPSTETFVTAALTMRHKIKLVPALTWKTVVAQVKDVPPGEFIGYGREYRTTHDSRIAVLPVGYHDGYDRGLSNLAFVLIHGKRAPVRGRICMNMTMVDVTDIDDVKPMDEVVLLGRQGDDEVSADTLAKWAKTINYEITTRIAEHVPRVLTEEDDHERT